MTYNVFSWTLNLTQSTVKKQQLLGADVFVMCLTEFKLIHPGYKTTVYMMMIMIRKLLLLLAL